MSQLLSRRRAFLWLGLVLGAQANDVETAAARRRLDTRILVGEESPISPTPGSPPSQHLGLHQQLCSTCEELGCFEGNIAGDSDQAFLCRQCAGVTRADCPIPIPQSSVSPTAVPSPAPTSRTPTDVPSTPPTKHPTTLPTLTPTPLPSLLPTNAPTLFPTVSPTVRPTGEPSSTPTPLPSTLPPSGIPTMTPTTIPTANPTSEPSPLTNFTPTASFTNTPTAASTTDDPKKIMAVPTAQPTHIATAPATTDSTGIPYENKKICNKCDRNGCFSGEKSVNDQKCLKWKCELRTSCPTYTSSAALSGPESSIKLRTGKVCSMDEACTSGVCRNGACMASSECYPVKHEYGTPFDKNRINLVFVGSAFENKQLWRSQVNNTYNFMKGYNIFAENIKQLNVFLVEPGTLDPSFCYYNCEGIERMLCCRIEKAQKLSSRCLPDGANVQTIVIHNDDKYGGAGYNSLNLATMSSHKLGAEVVVHELGHSLFELTDEYSYGGGTDRDPNCDSSSDCTKWSDLIERTPNGYGSVSCVPGCNHNKFFVGYISYMRVLNQAVGAVNERYTCCTYLALTKSMPPYCKAFDFEPGYLMNFCKFKDHQNYGAHNYDAEPKQAIAVGSHKDNSKYIYVLDPLVIDIRLKNGAAKILAKPLPGQPGLYRRERVMGDFKSVAEAAKNGFESIALVKVMYLKGGERFFFSTNTTIEAPSLAESQSPSSDNVVRVSEEAEVLNMVLDAKGRTVKRIRPKLLRT